MENSLDLLTDERELTKFMDNPTRAVAEVFIGIMKSDKWSKYESGFRLFDSLLKKRLIQQLVSEVERYQEAGKVKMDYMETDYNRMALKEVFKIIDEDPPDEEKFKAIKSLFLCNIEGKATEGDQMLTYQYLQVVNKLSSGEIILLKSMWEAKDYSKRKDGVTYQFKDEFKRNWCNAMAIQAGFSSKHGTLVELHAKKLHELRLMGKLPEPVLDGHINPSENNMLTPLGINLCEFITKYG